MSDRATVRVSELVDARRRIAVRDPDRAWCHAIATGLAVAYRAHRDVVVECYCQGPARVHQAVVRERSAP